MWQRFTERARRVVFFAQEEAARTGHNFVGSEHLLLGLLREEDTVAGVLLEQNGVDLVELRVRIEQLIVRGEANLGMDMQLTPEAKLVIDHSYDEARALNDLYIGTEHLLLGLLRATPSLAAQELSGMGIQLETARRSVQAAREAHEAVAAPKHPEAREKLAGGDGGATWGRFTERARRVVFFAQEEAALLGENYVGTEHLLLGVIREADSVASRILDRLGVPLGRIRADIDRQVTRGHGHLGDDMQLTPRGKRVIDLAYEEARAINNQYIGTEHLLLGLIREGDGLAARVLVELGADLERVRQEVWAMQEGEGTEGAPHPLSGGSGEGVRHLIPRLNLAIDNVRSGPQAAGSAARESAVAVLSDTLTLDLSTLGFDSTAKVVEKATDVARALCADLTDLRAITDLSRVQAETLLILAQLQKKTLNNDKEAHSYTLRGKTLAMVFEKQSLRTRVSFEVGMFQLGGHAIYLQPADISMGKRETVADVTRNLDRMVDGIMARVFAHSTIVELAEHSRVPVINGLCDREHPCQALCDFLTILEHRGTVAGQKVVYVGDGNNVAHSLLLLGAKLGAHVVIACPKGYEPLAEIVALGEADGAANGGSVVVTNDARAAAEGADVLYTDVWTSMGQEAETQQRLKDFTAYQINAELAALAKPDYLFMHCLPAHRGEEVSAEVADGPNSVIFDQAENRLHAQKAVMSVLL